MKGYRKTEETIVRIYVQITLGKKCLLLAHNTDKITWFSQDRLHSSSKWEQKFVTQMVFYVIIFILFKIYELTSTIMQFELWTLLNWDKTRNLY
jgi:hypothetical protein